MQQLLLHATRHVAVVPLPQRRHRDRFSRTAVRAVASTAQQKEYAGPRKVAVVGGGPAGLTTAIALRQLCPEVETVKVFEQYESLPPELGAAFNINGGAAVLAKLGLEQGLLAIGNPMERVYSRTTEGSVLFDFQPPQLLDTVGYLVEVEPCC